jgi:hypothetical protein
MMMKLDVEGDESFGWGGMRRTMPWITISVQHFNRNRVQNKVAFEPAQARAVCQRSAATQRLAACCPASMETMLLLIVEWSLHIVYKRNSYVFSKCLKL